MVKAAPASIAMHTATTPRSAGAGAGVVVAGSMVALASPTVWAPETSMTAPCTPWLLPVALWCRSRPCMPMMPRATAHNSAGSGQKRNCRWIALFDVSTTAKSRSADADERRGH